MREPFFFQRDNGVGRRRFLFPEPRPPASVSGKTEQDITMRSGCLWLLGVPLPIIILLWLITGHA